MITLETACAYALRDRRVMDALGPLLRDDLVVANPLYRRVMAWADDFARERGKLPAPGDWELWTSSLGDQEAPMLREALGRLTASRDLEATFDAEHFAERVTEDLRKGAARVALTRLNAMDAPDPEALRTLSERVDALRASTLSGLADLRDIDLWIRSAGNDVLMPTGFHALDASLGGWGAELWMIFADAKAGKSMLLSNFAVLAAQKGKTVLIVTLELRLRSLIHRCYRRIAEAERGEFVTDLDCVRGRIEHWWRFARGGQVLLLEFPAYGLDPHALLRTAEQVKRLRGLDLLVTDYADLMALPKGMRGAGRYEDLGKITHMMREPCAALEIPHLTASQAVRRPANADRLTAKDMGDSYEKVRGADGLISLVQTEEEAEAHQGRVGIVMARESPSGVEVPVYINRDMALIAELDHPNTVQLMRRLGHVPIDPRAREETAVPAGGGRVGR